MNRRLFLQGVGGLAVLGPWLRPNFALGAPVALQETHFPDRLHQFVWRNWALATADRLAEVARCRPEEILAVGASMGLPEKPTLTEDQLRRIYITAIRQNWHLLPNDQLTQLLGWTPEHFQFTLKEDDFLDIKLGAKPDLNPVTYTAPGEAARKRAAEIKGFVEAQLARIARPDAVEEPFAFIPRLSGQELASLRDPAAKPAPNQVDLSGWAVRGDASVDGRIIRRLGEYLATAMDAGPAREGAKEIRLRIDQALGGRGERFAVEAGDDGAEVVGNSVGGLLRGVYWLQDRMEEAGGPFLDRGRSERSAAFYPRFLYSYFALYGDPLLETEIDPFPEGFLEKLARSGASGVWMQGVLNTLAPSKEFPEFGKGSEERLAALNKFVERAAEFGLKVYLYLNEPRAMPAEFFRGREEMRGSDQLGYYAMCTADPRVREWISDSLAHVFAKVPGLGGVVTITMSENLTNCFSRFRPQACPRCSQRKEWGEGVEEVLVAIRDGIRRSSKDAEVIAWDWGWTEEQARYAIPRLPKDVRFQSVSEWSQPVERGGVKSTVGEYSISVVGPGPRATSHWKIARESGITPFAKVQLNNTWEISAVPYVPVANLVAQHCVNLANAGVAGLMESWTLGGYPSPNLEIAKEVSFSPGDPIDRILARVARRRYGREAAPAILEAWKGFSDAYEEYPYGVHVYLIPTQHGPANLLRAQPTGAEVGMILFPQDAYKVWSGAYPPAVVRDQFAKMADGWEAVLPRFREAVAKVPATRKRVAEEDLAIAEACLIHFRSVANQVAFCILRDGEKTPEARERMRELARQEQELARRLYPLAQRHSVIAYEATNHYYYRPLDLVEKMLNCQYLLDHEI